MNETIDTEELRMLADTIYAVSIEVQATAGSIDRLLAQNDLLREQLVKILNGLDEGYDLEEGSQLHDEIKEFLK